MAPHNTGSKRLKNRRQQQRRRKQQELLLLLPQLVGAHTREVDSFVHRHGNADSFVEWGALHPELDPGLTQKAALPEKRAVRKRAQISEILSWASALLPRGGTAVDFCAGSGHVGLVLAAIRPDAIIYIVEKKTQHCEIAQQRVDLAELKNVRIANCQLSDFTTPFDVGMGLHACGPATDLIHSLCISAAADYVLAPCCYGFIAKALDRYRLEYVDHNANASMVHIEYSQLPPVSTEEDAWVRHHHGSWEGLENESALGGLPGGHFCRGAPVALGSGQGGVSRSERVALASAHSVDTAASAETILAREGLRMEARDEEDEKEQAKWREACVFRARVKAAAMRQGEREAAAPLRGTINALDALLSDLAGAVGPDGRRQLHQHERRMEEVTRSFWGCGVVFPRSKKVREVLGAHEVDLYACLAGSADGTMWASEGGAGVSVADKDAFARQCMRAVDGDRSMCAEEAGYMAAVTCMCAGDTEKAGQKNHLLVGRYLGTESRRESWQM